MYYGDIIEYSVVTYCEKKFSSTKAGDVALKPMLAAMLNYGAAAQKEFDNYNIENPANACLQKYVSQGLLDAKYQEMNWDDSYLTATTAATAAMSVNFQKNEAARTARRLELGGQVRVMMTFAYKLQGNFGTKLAEGASVEIYYWTEATYKKLEASGTALTKENADVVRSGDEVEQSYDKTYGYEYSAFSDGIDSNKMSDTLYSAAVFTMADGTEYCSGVEAYSPEDYAKSKKDGSDKELADLVKWMVIYGEEAYKYFSKS